MQNIRNKLIAGGAVFPPEKQKRPSMRPKQLLRFVTTFPIIIAVCGLPLHAQHLVDPRSNPRAARDAAGRAAAAAKAAAAKDASIAQVITIPPPTAVGTFATFEFPGKVIEFTINGNGAITSYYIDNVGSGFHGFVRAKNGTVTTFDVPGSVNGTFPIGISNNDAVTGGYGDTIGSGFHGFVRAANGTLVTFDAPGGLSGTEGFAINPSGTVLGAYFDANFTPHCFLRMPDGTLTTADPPSAVNGCVPSAITPDGAIVGSYTDANNINYGFLRTPSGTFTVVGPSGNSGPFNGGPSLSINPPGEIAGSYFQPMAGNPFGGDILAFVQSPDGSYITFNAADYPPCCIFSWATGINPAGTVTGYLNDGFNINRGFLRTRDGTISIFDAPGAGTGDNEGTLAEGITPGGVILGIYRDANDVSHGFLFRPQ